jgi:4-methyl-5(b-hydroxyethyl)-thiazole monophosphate biosynthesis
MPSVLVPLATGFEEIETVTPIDLLLRAGATVTLAALTDELQVQGRCGLTLRADLPLAAASALVPDCLLLPGGPGVKLLRADARIRTLVTSQDRARRWLAAICAAPTVLLDAGVLPARRHTAHFSVASELPGLVATDRVVVDGHVITSRGAGTALEFGLEVVRRLLSPDHAAEVARSICA